MTPEATSTDRVSSILKVAVKSFGVGLFSFPQCAGNFVTEDVVGLMSSSARISLESPKSSSLVLDHGKNVFGEPGKITFR